ncbi:MAG: TraB/GumN family protein [Treponema sp.]|nr:TraB/GumN family protein [Treponema sp.]
MKKVFSFMTVIFVSLFLFVSCAGSPKAELVQSQKGLYWTVSGTDSKGKPSCVHILGTIHMGDDRLYPLPQEIMDDLENSSRIAAEVGSDDLAETERKMLTIMMESALKAHGRSLEKELTEDEVNVIVNAIGVQNFTVLKIFEPWVLMDTLGTLQWTKSGLTAEKGVDNTLMEMLKKKDRKWEGLDTLDDQLKILRYGTYDQQLYLLKELLAEIIDPTQSDEYLVKMYGAYLNGDAETLTQIIFAEEEEDLKNLDADTLKFMIEYNNLIMTQRNKAWAEKIKAWLKEGGETFIFAGSAHFLGDGSVFTYLKKNGVLQKESQDAAGL